MAACPTCGAEGTKAGSPGAPCLRCGALLPLASSVVAVRPAAAPSRPRPVDEPIELAVDPRAPIVRVAALSPVSPSSPLAPTSDAHLPVEPHDVDSDARLLADYGDAPRHWLLSPPYALRVIRRRRELKRALAGRRAEAVRVTREVEDALVAFAETLRIDADKAPSYASAMADLRAAEQVLRSRDRVLAAEQDGQTARLSSVGARLSKLEEDLARAQAEESAVAGEITTTQAAIAREEGKVKRAEMELRAAQQREAAGITS